ncbi:hypothetical protein DITRI_Ditri02bG0166200 [Diplodiscus trichospermus]
MATAKLWILFIRDQVCLLARKTEFGSNEDAYIVGLISQGVLSGARTKGATLVPYSCILMHCIAGGLQSVYYAATYVVILRFMVEVSSKNIDAIKVSILLHLH